MPLNKANHHVIIFDWVSSEVTDSSGQWQQARIKNTDGLSRVSSLSKEIETRLEITTMGIPPQLNGYRLNASTASVAES